MNARTLDGGETSWLRRGPVRAAAFPARAARRLPLLTFAVLGAMGIAAMPGVASLLEYDRTAVGAGQVSRLLTGHLTHWSSSHFFWNAIGVTLLGAWCEQRDRSVLPWLIALSAVAIALAIHVTLPDLSRYRGMSGIVSALFGFVAVTLVRDQWRAGSRPLALLAAACAIGFAAHCARVWLANGTVIAADMPSDVSSVPLVHAVGFAVGVSISRAPFFQRKDQRS